VTATWTERYADSLMNTFGPPKRVLVRGEGCYVWDTEGQRYVDLLAGIAVNALGHGHPAIRETLADQAGRLGHVSNFFATEPQITLAERLLDLLGAGGDTGAGGRAGGGKVFFTNSGAEANEAAFKLTRRTGRTKVVAAEGAFHGRTMGALALTANPAYREPFEPLPGDVVWVPYGDVDALAAAVDDETAAILLEPIQGEAGVVVPPDGYLGAARRIADAHGALLWLDEVQTGIGRTGDWFAFQHHSTGLSDGARPDVVTLAKGLGGGFPIGACVALGRAGDLLGPGQHGTTFGGNPLAAAVALTVLDVIEKEDLLASVRTNGAALAAAIADLDGVHGVRGRGLHLGATVDADRAKPVATAALDGGVIVNDCGRDTLRFAPPLVLGPTEMEQAVPVLAVALAHEATPSAPDPTSANSASGMNLEAS
jgi:acetylornithine/N-succinyldiaminopimelate aminotransferase